MAVRQAPIIRDFILGLSSLVAPNAQTRPKAPAAGLNKSRAEASPPPRGRRLGPPGRAGGGQPHPDTPALPRAFHPRTVNRTANEPQTTAPDLRGRQPIPFPNDVKDPPPLADSTASNHADESLAR